MTEVGYEAGDGVDAANGCGGSGVFDISMPALARVYDAVLGGATNFAADRELAARILRIIPGYGDFVRANRAFIRRAAEYMVGYGVDQFLDLGAGMCSFRPVHDVVHRVNPSSRVVYVDNDPVAAAHLRLGIQGDPRVGVLDADLCDVDGVLDHPVTRSVLDLNRPVGVFTVAVLHCLTDRDRPDAVLRGYHDRLATGSMLAASHVSGDILDQAVVAAAIAVFAEAGIGIVSRTREEFVGLLGPWQPQEDGVVPIHLWRPDAGGVVEEMDSLGYALLAASTRPPAEGRE